MYPLAALIMPVNPKLVRQTMYDASVPGEAAHPLRESLSRASGAESRDSSSFKAFFILFFPSRFRSVANNNIGGTGAVGLRRHVATSARDEKGRKIANCGLATTVGIHCTTYNVLSTVTSHHAFNWGGARWSLFAFVPPHRAPIVSLPPDCPFLSERTYSTDVLHRRAKNG